MVFCYGTSFGLFRFSSRILALYSACMAFNSSTRYCLGSCGPSSACNRSGPIFSNSLARYRARLPDSQSLQWAHCEWTLSGLYRNSGKPPTGLKCPAWRCEPVSRLQDMQGNPWSRNLTQRLKIDCVSLWWSPRVFRRSKSAFLRSRLALVSLPRFRNMAHCTEQTSCVELRGSNIREHTRQVFRLWGFHVFSSRLPIPHKPRSR
jgi:hypothetical protein